MCAERQTNQVTHNQQELNFLKDGSWWILPKGNFGQVFSKCHDDDSVLLLVSTVITISNLYFLEEIFTFKCIYAL